MVTLVYRGFLNRRVCSVSPKKHNKGKVICERQYSHIQEPNGLQKNFFYNLKKNMCISLCMHTEVTGSPGSGGAGGCERQELIFSLLQ